MSCETAREINDAMIDTMLQSADMEVFKKSLATLDRRLRRRGRAASPTVRFALSRAPIWAAPRRLRRSITAFADGDWRECSLPQVSSCPPIRWPSSATASSWVCEHGMCFLHRLGWAAETVDKIICHQVGGRPPRFDPQDAGHRGGQGVFDVSIPRQHGHGVAAVNGGIGGGTWSFYVRAIASAFSASAAV